MKRIFGSLALLLALALTYTACHKTGPVQPGADQRTELTVVEKNVISSTNTFGLSLFRKIHDLEKAKSENIFISPLSVSMALGMTLNGAGGATLDSMKKTLALSGLTDQQINESYRDILALLSSLDPTVAFQIANSIWCRAGFSVDPDFISTNQQYFNAAVSSLDFSSPGAASTINAWVSEKTNNRIPDIVAAPIDPATVMFLINAIYFKGAWTYIFDSTLTSGQLFTKADAETVRVSLMKQTAKYLYYENDRLQMVDLPYGKGDFRMTVVLPREGSGMDGVVGLLDATTWGGWVAGLDSLKGEVYLPKFKIKYELEMNQVLSLLGMAVAFDPNQANFSRISPSYQLFISKVKHKSFIEVNEHGTEAAAVTVVEVGYSSYPPIDSFVMRMDRPFLFVIRDAPSGTILFIGEIGNPAVSE